jgi:flagellar basal-body rod protein FlgB
MMDFTSARQKILANNLANSSTPGFIRKDLDFQSALAEKLKGGEDITAVAQVQGKIVEDHSSPARLDGNNVTVSTELSQLMQNSTLGSLLQRPIRRR